MWILWNANTSVYLSPRRWLQLWWLQLHFSYDRGPWLKTPNFFLEMVRTDFNPNFFLDMSSLCKSNLKSFSFLLRKIFRRMNFEVFSLLPWPDDFKLDNFVLELDFSNFDISRAVAFARRCDKRDGFMLHRASYFAMELLYFLLLSPSAAKFSAKQKTLEISD